MLVARHYHDGTVEHDVDPSTISERRHVGVVWVDIEDATDADLDLVAEEFSLHPLAMEDARVHGQRPKLVRYPEHAFIVAYSGDMAEVDLFTGPTWVVTVRGSNDEGVEWDPAEARRRYELQLDGRDADTGMLVYVILDDLVDGYFERLDEAEDHVEELEELVFSDDHGAEKQIQRGVYDARRRLLRFRRNVAPLRDVLLALLRREVPWIEGEELLLLADVHDRVLRVTDIVDSARELLGNVVDAHLALVSNRLNLIMRRLTAWGSILLVPTLIASVYGMNFSRMPELDWRLGYPMALVIMLGSATGLYVWFRSRDWL